MNNNMEHLENIRAMVPGTPVTPARKKVMNGSSSTGSGKKNRLSPSGLNYVAGSRVEAKGLSGQWFPARISEVDWEEREILIHFDNNLEKDEWMSMDSQRVRPYREPDVPNLYPATQNFSRVTGRKGHFFPEPKPVERRFKIGEQVMATWSNNRKYCATILAPQPDDRYDVMFYDGFRKSVRGSRISKMKDSDHLLAQQKSLEELQLSVQGKQKPTQMHGLAPHSQLQATSQHIQHGLLKSHLQNGNLLTPNKLLPPLPKSPNQTGLSQIEKRLPLNGSHFSPPPPAPIVDGLLPIDENIGTKEQRRERKRKHNVKELFSHKRPRGSDKQSGTSKPRNEGKKLPLNSNSVGASASRSSSQASGNKLTLGVDPMFPANPMKVEGFSSVNQNNFNEKHLAEGGDFDKKKKRKMKKKRLGHEHLQPSVTSPKCIKSQSGDEDESGIQWNNGEPQGEAAYVIESAEGPRKSIIVEDRRLPEGWCKHAIRRQGGSSAGKWDVFLVSPMDGRKFRSRNELRSYHNEKGLQFQVERFDFSLGRKKMFRQKAAAATQATVLDDRPDGTAVPAGETAAPGVAGAAAAGQHPPAPHSITPHITPLGQQRVKTLLPRARASTSNSPNHRVLSPPPPHAVAPQPILPTTGGFDNALNMKSLSASSDRFVCPKDGCGKRFRNENLLQMHIKYKHPEYNAFMGSTPNVADLAYARTVGESASETPNRNRGQSSSFMEKISEISRMEAHRKAGVDTVPSVESSSSLEAKSPTLGKLLKLGPMRKDSVDGTTAAAQAAAAWMVETASDNAASLSSMPDIFKDRSLLPSHANDSARDSRADNGSRPASRVAGLHSESDQDASNEPSNLSPWKLGTSDGLVSASASCSPVTVQHSSYFYSKKKKKGALSVKSSPEIKQEEGKPPSPAMEHLRREELINCTCGITEEDGLMIQCDLCLCWQHGICNKIENIEEVPNKYVCLICLNPVRERRSRHFIHDQDWLKEGVLPSFSFTKKNPEKKQQREDILKQSHDLCALLLQTQKVIHSLRVKVHIAEQKDHPKLYLWANCWVKESMGCSTPPPSPALDSEPKQEPIGVVGKGKSLLQEALLNGSPQQQLQHHQHQPQLGKLHSYAMDAPRVPQPEAPIDPGECRIKLLDHIEHFQSLVDARLSAVENMIDALEKEDPTLVDDKHPEPVTPVATGADPDELDQSDESHQDSFPQTKETVQMVLRDLLKLRKISTL